MMRNVIFKKNNLLYMAIVLMAFLWTFSTSRRLVEEWGWSTGKNYPLPIWLAQLISVPLLSSAFFLFRKLLLQDRWLRWVGLGYLLVFLAIGLLLAPGCLVEDSFYTFHMVRMGWWSAWYSVLHPMLITALLQILPWEFWGPSILLALAWAAFFIFLHYCICLLRGKSILHMLVLLIAINPLTIAASAIIIRDSYFTLAFLGFILLCFHLLVKEGETPYLNFLPVGFVGGFVAIYRIDCLPSVVILLAGICFILKKMEKIRIFRYGLASAILPVLTWLFLANTIPNLFGSNLIVGNSWDNRAAEEYQLTLIENPLGYIVKSQNKNISSSDEKILEKVFVFSDLQKFHCPENICVFYGNHWNKKSNKMERNEAFWAALRIFAENPILFFQSKIETLKSVGKKSSQTSCSFGSHPIKYNFLINNDYFGEWRIKLTNYFNFIEGESSHRMALKAIIASVSGCFFIIFCWRKAPATAFLAFILLARSLAVFFTAPAGFLMYYFSILIGGAVVGILWIAEVRFNSNAEQVVPNGI